jgi:hypothetical protein
MRDARLDVMYRYVEEYTNRHDLAVARRIMHPDYRFTMGDTTLDLESYLAMVAGALDHFTDLRLVVNEFIVGPQRLAMLFTETAASPTHGRTAAWRGAALYTFHPDGRLLAVTVQQDFWGRRSQYKGLQTPQTPASTAPAVWETPAGADDPAVRSLVSRALRELATADVGYDDGAEPSVAPTQVEATDIILSGRRFAAALEISGALLRGPDDSTPVTGPATTTTTLTAVGAGTLSTDGTIIEAHFVTDRWGLFNRLRNDPDNR